VLRLQATIQAGAGRQLCIFISLHLVLNKLIKNKGLKNLHWRLVMKTPTLFLLFIFLLVGTFTALNWDAFLEPTDLSLIFTKVQVSLGLIMLGTLIVVTFLFLAFVAYLQGSVLLEARRHLKELQFNRELADKAEASRFTELRTFLEHELAKQVLENNNTKASIIARMDKLIDEVSISLEQTNNTFGAYIGEFEDRLEKKGSQ
jgi:hypothetical protein